MEQTFRIGTEQGSLRPVSGKLLMRMDFQRSEIAHFLQFHNVYIPPKVAFQVTTLLMKSWIFVIRTFPPFLIPAQRHTPSFSANSPCVPSVKSCVLSNCAFHEKVLFRHLYCVKNEGILLTIFAISRCLPLLPLCDGSVRPETSIKRGEPPYCALSAVSVIARQSRSKTYPQ